MAPRHEDDNLTDIEPIEANGLDSKLRVAILTASAVTKKSIKFECEQLGLKDCTDFSFAHELIPILKVTSCHLLVTAGEVGDMHWSTFFRALRTDPNIPFIPTVFIPSGNDPTIKQHIQLLSSLHIPVLHKANPSYGDFNSFSSAVKHAINDERNVGTFAASLSQAKSFFMKGLNLQANRVYKSLLKEKPDDTLANLGVIQTAGFGDKQVFDQLQHLIASDPSNYCFWFELLNYFLENKSFGRFAEAFEAFSADLRTASDTYWLYQLATMCLSLRQPKFAARCVAMIEENNSPNCEWIPYYIRTRIHLDAGNQAMAEQELAAAHANCKFHSAEIHNVAGIIQRRKKMNAEALKSFSTAAQITPLDYRIQYNLAIAYLEDGQKGRAIHALNRAIEIYPNYTRATSKLQEVTSG